MFHFCLLFSKYQLSLLFGSRGVFGFFGFGGEFSISFVVFDPSVFGTVNEMGTVIVGYLFEAIKLFF